MWEKIKSAWGNFRRHKLLFALLVLSIYGCITLFHKFYELQLPYTLRGIQVDRYAEHNELVSCRADLQDALAGKEAAVKALNPDLFQ